MDDPLILVTNDDGIAAAGLWAAVEALLPLGEVLVVAPDRQWSGAGRSFPQEVTGRITPASRLVAGAWVTAYAVDASPALAVIHAMTEFCLRRPSLVVSGINNGLNMGNEVTISGTVGAALEAGTFGIPALAVSLEMDPAYHLTGDERADYRATQAQIRFFAQQSLAHNVPHHDVAALNLNVPASATLETPWRVTRLARSRYWAPIAPNREQGQGRPGYRVIKDVLSPSDSDIWAVMVDRVVSVSPVSLDLTSRIDLELFGSCLREGYGLRWEEAELALVSSS